MFTGIIQSTGAIGSVTPLGDGKAGVSLRVRADTLDCDDIAIGDSIAVSGVCLTVIARQGSQLGFDVSAETLGCTTGLDEPGAVNLEKALRFGDRLGGHLVSGHVDGVGAVVTFRPEGESHRLEIVAPMDLARFIAVKGSITVDGVSLTVNEVAGSRFAINLIPHTLAVTTLGQLHLGRRVNLEVDMLARYLDRLMAGRLPIDYSASELLSPTPSSGSLQSLRSAYATPLLSLAPCSAEISGVLSHVSSQRAAITPDSD